MSRRILSDEEKALLASAMQDVRPLDKKKRITPAKKTISVKPAPPTTNQPLPTILDLHGLTLEQAHKRLVVFMEAHAKAGARELLIITGKSGELKHEVPRWLTLSDMKTHISMLSKAKPKQGGDGALCVRLKKRK